MQDPTSAPGLTKPGDFPPSRTESVQEHAEPAMGEAQKVSISCSPRMRIFAIGINILVISELTVAMYMASLQPDEFTPVFFKVFFGLLVPTLIGAFVGRRMIAKAEQ
ncbi:hypothetical protein LJC46_04855 [Desulfovibrio sp. OttesenSCG-928-G15]|nr:hypothetical protein [Desulfovibrio sp. OttesenSCG-928-G15]